MVRVRSVRIKVIIGILLLILSVTGYCLIYYYRDLIFGAPVLFIEDDNIKIGLYPDRFHAAFVFTIDDVNKLTDPQNVKNVVNILNRYGAKGVFFVIPYYKGRYKVTMDDEIIKALQQITEEGHEIAQHGLTHSVPRKKLKIVNQTKEFVDLPYGEQKRRILTGEKIFEECGFQINGFRSPAFSANYDTLKILDNHFLYGSNVSIFPPPLLMANKRYAESIYYPFHPKDLNLIEFICHGDYFNGHSEFIQKSFLVITNAFERIYKHKGIFILISHIEPINNGKKLELLEKCLKYINAKNIWKPNLTELALWWKAREALYAESEIDNDTVKITLEKGNELALNGLTIEFKKELNMEKYEIIDADGNLIKNGKIDEKVVIINY